MSGRHDAYAAVRVSPVLSKSLLGLQKGSDRDVEAQLMHLLDFEHFDLVRELLKNRLTIVWCTRLQRAQADDERQRIEASSRPPSLHAHSCHIPRKPAPAQAQCGDQTCILCLNGSGV